VFDISSERFGQKSLPSLPFLVLTIINYRGVALGGTVQVMFTSLKVLALLFIVGMASNT
jgi:amino acid transporter